MQTVTSLEECSKQLMTAARQAMHSKDLSQEANSAYVGKFQLVMGIMEELSNLQKMWRAFLTDHGQARNTLISKAKNLAPLIKALGGGEHAVNYLSSVSGEAE